MSRYARIAVPSPVDRLFTYRIPIALETRIELGQSVLVPFSGRKLTGWILELCEAPEVDPAKVKDIIRLVDPVPVVDQRQADFLKWLSKYYASSLGDALSTALPSASRAKSRRVVVPTADAAEALAEARVEEPKATVLREIIRRVGRTPGGLARTLVDELTSDEVNRAIDALQRANLAEIQTVEVKEAKDRFDVAVLLIDPEELITYAPRAGSRMRSVVSTLHDAGGAMPLKQLQAKEGGTAREAARKLAGMGILRIESHERRDPIQTGVLEGAAKSPPPPTTGQAHALKTLNASDEGVFLLHGVTGSGKTEVYLQAATRTLNDEKQVLILVPEIGLTPQLVGRFRARFGDRIAVLHSGLSNRERLREWRRIRSGDATIAVGARSALFAPFDSLGLIVVDEEHDGSYKQDTSVRYNARDMAVVRGRLARCPVILGSATPSVESYQNAKDGRYTLLSMPERATPRTPPTVEVVDMNIHPRDANGQVPVLSKALRQAMHSALDDGGQAIVLYNRRGYATVVQCPDCGGRYSCPSCGISLVLHREVGRLSCHYCGLHRPAVRKCPACTGTLEILGMGSEQIEEILKQEFPGHTVARMDADVTTKRGAHHEILEAFRSGKTRILVGTQMVAKGHDFPNVRVAAILGIDHLLTLPDFRSGERAFGLATQLAGRAGRGEQSARVFLQTHHPAHYVFRCLGDYDAFHTEETRQRRILAYPPFTRLVMIRLDGVNREATAHTALELTRALRNESPEDGVLDILGPAPAPMGKLVGRYRFQVLLRGRRFTAFREWVQDTARPLIKKAKKKGVRISIDVDPRSLL